MARKLKEEAEEAPGTGHNGPDEETFLTHVRQVIRANQALDDAKSARQKIRKLAKADGIELKKLDAVITMMDWAPTEIRDHFDTLHRYAIWARLPVGSQLDLFAGVPEAAKTGLDWKALGFIAATTGKGEPGVPPQGCTGPDAQEWLAGWNEGQEKNAGPMFKAA